MHGRTVDAKEMTAAARRVRALLGEGPLRVSELVARLDADDIRFDGVNLWVDLVRVPPSGTWERRRADLLATAEDWLGPSNVTDEHGVEHLVRRYLGGFGPAAPRDVAGWAGLSMCVVARALRRLRLRWFRDERGDELVDLPRAPLPDPLAPAPVRFLPTWDATLLVHARRTQILPEDFRPLVFNTKTPLSVPTFLVDGHVAGAWRFERGSVRLHPFRPLPAATRRALNEEAERLAAFHG